MPPQTVFPRRKAAALFFVLLAACSRTESPERTYQGLWQAYISGDLPRTIQGASEQSDRWKHEQTSWFWKFRLLHAEALLGQGKGKEAAALLQTPLPADRALAQLELRRQLDVADAGLVSSPQQSIGLIDRIVPGLTDADLQIRAHLLRGLALLNSNDPDHAEGEFSAALQQAKTTGNQYRQAAAFNNLSLWARRHGDYEKAVEFAGEALQEAQRANARIIQAQALGNRANNYISLGNISAASDHLQQAIKVFEAIDIRSSLLTAWNLLGVIHDLQGDSVEAAHSYERAYKIALDLDRKNDAARAAANLSLTYLKDKKWSDAVAWNQKAADLTGGASANSVTPYIVRNQARIADHEGHSEEAVRSCGMLLEDSQKNQILRWEAYEILAGIDSRARRFGKANQEFDAALATIDRARSQLDSAQNRMTWLSHLIPFYQEYVDSLVEQKNDANALTIIESGRARVLSEALRRTSEPMVFDAAGLKRLAGSTGSDIISFWLGPDRSFAWLITPHDLLRFDLPPAAEIESLIASYRNTVEHSWGDPLASHDANAAKLWDVLLGKNAPLIPKGSKVLVIPDGALHRLNLETLPVPGPDPHYWVQDVDVAVAPSLTLVAGKPGSAHAGSGSLLLMGAPVAVANFEKLPQADAEISEIRSRFPGASVLTGASATVSAYRNAGPARFSLIHFAAHAEPNPESPLESAIVLSPSQGNYLLRARDIIGNPLSADLVTISACRSAGARVYAGEGLIGLAWAFLEAGSNAVIAGLWDVNDGSSRLLMDQLYAGIAAGQPPAVALRGAKIAMLQGDPRYRKPYFWGPFQTYVRSVRWGRSPAVKP